MARARVEQKTAVPSAGVVPPAEAPPPNFGRRVLKYVGSDWGIRALTFVALLAMWQIVSMIVSPVTFSSPSRTVEAFQRLLSTGTLIDAWRDDLFIWFSALGLSGLGGITLGFVLGRFRLLDKLLEPIMNALFMTPKIALLPIIALWLGFQTSAKIVVVVMFSFFEILFTVRNGVRAIDAEYIDVARAYSIPEGMMLRKVVAPATLPYVITGLRLGLLHGMVGLVLAGFFLENTGIGGLINESASTFRLPPVFAVLFTVMIVGVTMNVGLRAVERRLAPWSGPEAK